MGPENCKFYYIWEYQRPTGVYFNCFLYIFTVCRQVNGRLIYKQFGSIRSRSSEFKGFNLVGVVGFPKNFLHLLAAKLYVGSEKVRKMQKWYGPSTILFPWLVWWGSDFARRQGKVKKLEVSLFLVFVSSPWVHSFIPNFELIDEAPKYGSPQIWEPKNLKFMTCSYHAGFAAIPRCLWFLVRLVIDRKHSNSSNINECLCVGGAIQWMSLGFGVACVANMHEKIPYSISIQITYRFRSSTKSKCLFVVP